ncbi:MULTISPECIES: DUF4359 domain-containing protein [Sphingobacterium]|uniref:Uncharacterized protein DUF4359 n=3 Tax=Sphingobacterium TaxID=28453 RepID=A0A420AM30_SPHD1|nr:DUF4359 domain-containing protein [Sphingobacterium detergens]RKE45512.1 uncharacterized protein DUF4359 [Sphingobacterium detergens]
MSKKRIFALLLVVIMLAAILTNPSKEEHEKIVRAKAEQLLKSQLHAKDQAFFGLGMQLFGNKLVDDFVQNSVVVDNYYLFSLTKIKWQGKEQIIGGGAFKQIWLSPKIDEKADEIIAALKKI